MCRGMFQVCFRVCFSNRKLRGCRFSMKSEPAATSRKKSGLWTHYLHFVFVMQSSGPLGFPVSHAKKNVKVDSCANVVDISYGNMYDGIKKYLSVKLPLARIQLTIVCFLNENYTAHACGAGMFSIGVGMFLNENCIVHARGAGMF